MPMTPKPIEKPDWISDTAGSVEEPSNAKKFFGFTLEKPPFQFFNWFWKIVSTWISWLCTWSDEVNNSLETKSTRTVADVTLTVDTVSDFDDAISFFSNIMHNDFTITVTGTYAGAYNKDVVIQGISGSGSIVWNLGSIGTPFIARKVILSNITNKFHMSAKISATLSNVNEAIKLHNMLDGYMAFNVNISSGFSSIPGTTTLIRCTGVSNIVFHNTVIDATNVGSATGIAYAVTVGQGSNVYFESASGVCVATVADVIPVAYILVHKGATVNYASSGVSFDTSSADTLYAFAEYSSHLKFSGTFKITTTLQYTSLVNLLKNAEVIDAEMDIHHNAIGSSKLEIENIHGMGSLIFSSSVTYAFPGIVIKKVTIPSIYFEGIDQDLTDAANTIIIEDANFVVIPNYDGQKSVEANAIRIKRSTVKLGTVTLTQKATGEADDADAYTWIDIRDESIVTLLQVYNTMSHIAAPAYIGEVHMSDVKIGAVSTPDMLSSIKVGSTRPVNIVAPYDGSYVHEIGNNLDFSIN